MTETLPPDEWTAEKRERMRDLEANARQQPTPSFLRQKALRDAVQRGEFTDDTRRAADAEMDPD